MGGHDMKITKLRTNHLENPLGYYLGQPELSWIVSEAKGKTCTGVRIQVSQDQAFEKVIYDSGRMEKADSLGFPLPVPPMIRSLLFNPDLISSLEIHCPFPKILQLFFSYMPMILIPLLFYYFCSYPAF